MDINTEIITKLHYKDVSLIAVALGEYQRNSKEHGDVDILKHAERLANRLGSELYDTNKLEDIHHDINKYHGSSYTHIESVKPNKIGKVDVITYDGQRLTDIMYKGSGCFYLPSCSGMGRLLEGDEDVEFWMYPPTPPPKITDMNKFLFTEKKPYKKELLWETQIDNNTKIISSVKQFEIEVLKIDGDIPKERMLDFCEWLESRVYNGCGNHYDYFTYINNNNDVKNVGVRFYIKTISIQTDRSGTIHKSCKSAYADCEHWQNNSSGCHNCSNEHSIIINNFKNK